MLGLTSHPVLIAETDAQIEEARVRLARVGIEELDGYLAGGVAAWKQAGLADGHGRANQSARARTNVCSAGKVQVLDVRREPEWDAGTCGGRDLVAAGQL